MMEELIARSRGNAPVSEDSPIINSGLFCTHCTEKIDLKIYTILYSTIDVGFGVHVSIVIVPTYEIRHNGKICDFGDPST